MCKTKEYLEQQIQGNDLIYIDSCSLLNTKQLKIFIRNSKEVFKENNKKIIVPEPVLNEITRFSVNAFDTRYQMANRSLELINKNKELFEIQENPNDSYVEEEFADNVLLNEILNNRLNKSQLLITNDRHLAEDVYAFNDIHSVRGKEVRVNYIGKGGELRESVPYNRIENRINEIEYSNQMLVEDMKMSIFDRIRFVLNPEKWMRTLVGYQMVDVRND